MGKNKGTKKRKLLQENPVAEDHAMDEEQPEQQVEQGGEQAEPPIDQTEARESDEEENEEEGAEDRGKMKVPELPPHVEHILPWGMVADMLMQSGNGSTTLYDILRSVVQQSHGLNNIATGRKTGL